MVVECIFSFLSTNFKLASLIIILLSVSLHNKVNLVYANKQEVGAGEIQRSLIHHHAAGDELQGRWVWRLLGLDKQT